MINIKLVVIGASGVGKTSLRSQYISGRFSNGYRATIGADFITKTLPHPTLPDECVVLQIWDTAGQERFSSLSSAFFRGADAVLLMFDVNDRKSFDSLSKWWLEFKERAPLLDEDMAEYCCVVVGNKMDLVRDDRDTVTEPEALQFIHELIPIPSRPPSPGYLDLPAEDSSDDEMGDDNPLSSSQLTERPHFPLDGTQDTERSGSIAILQPTHLSRSPKRNFSKSRSRSSSRFYGTVSTTRTAVTIYHTPSSSLFDSFHSARTSPISSPNRSPVALYRRARSGSTSSGSAVTITPSLFAREQVTTTTTPEDDPVNLPPELPLIPERGPKLFLTSAKTGEGVKDVFEYIAQRVVSKWEYDERVEARRLHMQEEGMGSTIRLGFESDAMRSREHLLGQCCGA